MRLLFIRFSSIGDIVLASPAFRCAKMQLPGVEIHLLTKQSMKAVTEANPYIDQFHYFDKDLNAVIQELKGLQFDYVIDLHKNLRSFRVKRALSCPSYTIKKLSWQKFLLTKFGLNFMPDRHISLRSVDTLAPLGVSYDGQGLDHFVPNGLQLPVNFLPESCSDGFVAIVIGASYATKKLPTPKLIELTKLIEVPMVLVGGKEDAAAGQAIEQSNPSHIFNACGKLNLHESALLMKQARMVVSHDTGFLYVACAYHQPTVAIWGGTSPKLQVEPFYPDTMSNRYWNAIVPNLSCQPCSNFGLKKCPKGHFNCMNHQDLTQIALKIQSFLNNLQ